MIYRFGVASCHPRPRRTLRRKPEKIIFEQFLIKSIVTYHLSLIIYLFIYFINYHLNLLTFYYILEFSLPLYFLYRQIEPPKLKFPLHVTGHFDAKINCREPLTYVFGGLGTI